MLANISKQDQDSKLRQESQINLVELKTKPDEKDTEKSSTISRKHGCFLRFLPTSVFTKFSYNKKDFF